MPIAVNGLDGNTFTTRDCDGSANNFIYSQHLLAFSGSYTSGANGDTLDLSGVAAIMATSGFSMLPFGFAEGNGTGTSQSAVGGYYQVQRGTTLKNYTVKIFNSGGTELGSGAYGAAILNDVVVLQLTWRKML